MALNANERFSLFDFCKKNAGRIEIYRQETLDEEGNIIGYKYVNMGKMMER